MKTFTAFESEKNTKSLHELCMELLSEQKKVWGDLNQGYESLEHMKTREIICKGYFVRVQHNPGRITSTLADVKGKSIKQRPCFLCIDNLPEVQKGILYKNKFLILCNPMPVFSGHLTIACLNHQPQAIAEHVDLFLHLANDFGKNWSVLYNGPRCGASAPDHLHFQAIPSGNMPVEKDVTDERQKNQIIDADGVQISRMDNLGRGLIILEGNDPTRITDIFKYIVTQLKKISDTDNDNEPMINIIGNHDGENWRLIIFPRAKHRPDAFFRKGVERIAVSPAVVEMGGVIVTPIERDFERLDASMVEELFSEVSLKGGIVGNFINTFE